MGKPRVMRRAERLCRLGNQQSGMRRFQRAVQGQFAQGVTGKPLRHYESVHRVVVHVEDPGKPAVRDTADGPGNAHNFSDQDVIGDQVVIVEGKHADRPEQRFVGCPPARPAVARRNLVL